MTIRTRFAPSPTGFLHIGGVRTALFNWLLTKRHTGQFILRIDDTDTERNKPEALQPILDGFRWLGINWDEGPDVGGGHGPYYQSQRLDRYKEAAFKLMEAGHAYPDYQTKEQLDAERQAAEKAKRAYVHRGPHRDTPKEQCVSLYAEKPAPLRFKIPLGRTSAIEDLICGHVEQKTDLIGDPVILRADGRALYNFATVVDDVDMQITHVIRAREHLSNTYSQVLFYEALGAAMPKFAHVPVVNEPGSKKKLSKRDMKKFVTTEIRGKLKALGYSDEEIDAKDDLNPATVAFYREMGYLPAALINYLGRLGWSMDDKSEVIPLETMIANFGLERVNDSPASFDPDKLYWLAGEYMRMLPTEEKVHGVIPYLLRARLISERFDDADRARIQKIVEAAGDRLKLFSDILTYGAFFFKDPEYDEAAFKKRVQKEGMPVLLADFKATLAAMKSFEPADIERELKEFCVAKVGLKEGDMIHALRLSTTGKPVGPGVYDCLAILGQAETVKRIDAALEKAGKP